MNRVDLKLLINTMNNYSNASGKWFSFGLNKNIQIIKDEMEIISKIEEDPKIIEYSGKRQALCEKYAQKDSITGEFIIKNGSFYGVAQNPLFQKAILELNILYENDLKEYNEIMNAEIDLNFYKIKFEHVPDNITPYDFTILKCMIEEPDIDQTKPIEPD